MPDFFSRLFAKIADNYSAEAAHAMEAGDAQLANALKAHSRAWRGAAEDVILLIRETPQG